MLCTIRLGSQFFGDNTKLQKDSTLSHNAKMGIITDVALAAIALTISILIVLSANGIPLGEINAIGSAGMNTAYIICATTFCVVLVDLVQLAVLQARHIETLLNTKKIEMNDKKALSEEKPAPQKGNKKIESEQHSQIEEGSLKSLADSSDEKNPTIETIVGKVFENLTGDSPDKLKQHIKGNQVPLNKQSKSIDPKVVKPVIFEKKETTSVTIPIPPPSNTKEEKSVSTEEDQAHSQTNTPREKSPLPETSSKKKEPVVEYLKPPPPAYDKDKIDVNEEALSSTSEADLEPHLIKIEKEKKTTANPNHIAKNQINELLKNSTSDLDEKTEIVVRTSPPIVISKHYITDENMNRDLIH